MLKPITDTFQTHRCSLENEVVSLLFEIYFISIMLVIIFLFSFYVHFQQVCRYLTGLFRANLESGTDFLLLVY